MTGEVEPAAQWHLDKRVPIAIIAALIAQSVTIGWWAATMSARVDFLERQSALSSDQPGRLVRVETRLDDARAKLDQIDAKLDRLIQQRGPMQ